MTLSKNQWGYLIPEGFPEFPENWSVETNVFKSPQDNAELFCCQLLSKKISRPLKAADHSDVTILVVIHGFAEHSGRYWHVAPYLASSLDGVYLWDHRGHGRSPGARGDAPDFEYLVEDAKAFLTNVVTTLRSKFDTVRLHVLGHSMGGLIALAAVRQLPFLIQSLILSAPALQLKQPPSWFKRFMVKSVSWLAPDFAFSIPLEASILSHDPQVCRAHEQDKLIHNAMTPRFFFGMQKLAQQILKSDYSYEMPMLFLIPGLDHLVSAQAIVEFSKAVQCPYQQVQEFPKCFHELLNEVQRAEVFEVIQKWMHKTASTFS